MTALALLSSQRLHSWTRRSWRQQSIVGAAVALLGGGFVPFLGSAPQAQAPVFGAGVEVVRLDVIVLDRQGKPVTGLSAQDFAIEEDGRPQSITSFERVVVRQGIEPERPEPPRVTENRVRAPEDGRCVFLFFNDVNVTPVVAERVRAALRQYLDRDVRAGDWVTLMAPEQQLWWTARDRWEYGQLRRVVDGIRGQYVRDPLATGLSDWQALCQDTYGEGNQMCNIGRSARAVAASRAATFRPVTPGGGIASPPSLIGGGSANGTLGVQEGLEFAKRRVSITVAGLRQALDSLAPLRGHKTVVLISEGFLLQPKMQGYQELIDAARRANVAVHFLDPRGLESGFTAESQDPEGGFLISRQDLDSAGASDLAGATGGHRLDNNNDLTGSLRRLVAESDAYYLLGYSPESVRTGERKVRVRVKRDGLSVQARNRYFLERSEELAKEDAKAKARDAKTGFAPRAVAAMRSLPDATDLPLLTSTLFFEANASGEVTTLLALELRPGGTARRHQLKIATEARNSDGRKPVHDRFEEAVDVTPGTPIVIARNWRLPAGVWQVRVLAQDTATGHVGSTVHTFEVPRPDGFRLSTPLVTAELDEAKRPRLSLGRRFAAGSTLYCQFGVHGAKAGSDGRPHVNARWQLRSGEGLVRETPATAIVATADGRLLRTAGISLVGLAPGDYELVLFVEDEQGRQATSRSERFSVGS